MDHRRICSPSLYETSLCGAYWYCASECSVFTACVRCACTNVQDSKWHRVLVPLCLHRSSQYTNSRALTDCTDCVTVWMALTVRGLRCEVRQFWDIMWIVERSLCGILECGYVEGRTKVFPRFWNLNGLSIYPSNCSYSLGRSDKRVTVYRDILIYLGCFADSDRYKLNVTRFSPF